MKTLFLSLSLIISAVGYSQNLTCQDFKIGTFKYRNNPNFENSIVVRTEKIQTESDPKLNIETEGTIEWITECSYQLTITKSPSKEAIGQIIHVEIIRIEGKTAICKSSVKEYNFEMELEMEKIK